jgi:hypothetical protein
LEASDPEAYLALHELRDDTRLVRHRDYLAYLLDQRAKIEAEEHPWEAGDVATFKREHEADPRSAHALHRICLKRLKEIKNDVEAADFPVGGDVRGEESEEELQKWFARKLDENSRNRYSVVREAEIHGRNRPDIRLYVPAVPPITIEIKWAHDWSFNQLLDSLDDQLVNRYMRASGAEHGVFLVANGQAGRSWRRGRRHYGFIDMVSILQEQATKLTVEKANVVDVQVISVDFTL